MVLSVLFLVLLLGGLLVLTLTLHEGLADVPLPSVPALLAFRFKEDRAAAGAEIGRQGRVTDGNFREREPVLLGDTRIVARHNPDSAMRFYME